MEAQNRGMEDMKASDAEPHHEMMMIWTRIKKPDPDTHQGEKSGPHGSENPDTGNDRNTESAILHSNLPVSYLPL
jgi:hypothetical protein